MVHCDGRLELKKYSLIKSDIFSDFTCPDLTLTEDDVNPHAVTCAKEVEPEEQKRGENLTKFIDSNYADLVRCVAGKVGLIEDKSTGKINPQERENRCIVNNCTFWDECREAHGCVLSD